MKRIIIIGGGFAGINLANKLAGDEHYDVVLVDRNNYNFFPPLIYQVATGFLEPSSISYPFRKLFRKKKNIHFRMGELLKVMPAENKVLLSTGELSYDYLVFATGAESNYFGMENVKKNAIPMKTLEDALDMRNTLLQRLEKASVETDPAERRKYLTLVVAGGGPTGVELSGMFAELRKTVLGKDYPELIGSPGNIYLVDGGQKLLAPMSAKSQQYTYDQLTKMGVHVRFNSQVKDFVNDQVILADGEIIEAKTLIWAAGVVAKAFEGIPADSYGRARRMIVDEYNKVKGTENIYAVGDTCIQTTDASFPGGHPQLAQVAIQQGTQLGKNFRAMARQQALKPFAYFDKGSLAIIGRNKAVADLPKRLHLNGFIAWFIWLFIHVVSLIDYRNRIKTMFNWMVSYFTKDQYLRMIIRPFDKPKAPNV